MQDEARACGGNQGRVRTALGRRCAHVAGAGAYRALLEEVVENVDAVAVVEGRAGGLVRGRAAVRAAEATAATAATMATMAAPTVVVAWTAAWAAAVAPRVAAAARRWWVDGGDGDGSGGDVVVMAAVATATTVTAVAVTAVAATAVAATAVAAAFAAMVVMLVVTAAAVMAAAAAAGAGAAAGGGGGDGGARMAAATAAVVCGGGGGGGGGSLRQHTRREAVSMCSMGPGRACAARVREGECAPKSTRGGCRRRAEARAPWGWNPTDLRRCRRPGPMSGAG